MLHQKFDKLKKKDGEECYADYQTGERLLTPFILIALPGSNKKAVPLNVSTLEKELLIDNLIPYGSSDLIGKIIEGESMYTVLSADGNYALELPNLLGMEYDVLGVKGYISLESVKKTLSVVHGHFNPQDKEPAPEDDIPF